jgi:hypothetical protein
LALEWHSGFTLRRRPARDDWTLTFLSSILCFNNMSKAGKAIRTGQQICDVLCHNGGLMGSAAVLVARARLGVDEADKPEMRRSRRLYTFGPD